ncbi:hypothetical protein ACVWYJ_007624 [Bradyrhizobium sp. USDA 4471]
MTQIPLSPSAEAEQPGFDLDRNDNTRRIVADVAYRQLAIVNFPSASNMPATEIGCWSMLAFRDRPGRSAPPASARFGGSGRPACIILTHWSFRPCRRARDAGGGMGRSGLWACGRASLFRRITRLPTGQSWGRWRPARIALAAVSTRPVNVASRLYDLPGDHSVPFMPEWQWIHTPGHISLWRERDRVLIAGDAFITTRQESVYSVVTQAPEMHGPPMYFTPDWKSAKQSVRDLAALAPEIAITGHGAAMQGPDMRAALETLAARFDDVAVPGNVAAEDATARNGDGHR